MLGFRVAGPIEQFEIIPIVPLKIGAIDISLTNSAFWMLLCVGAIIAFFAVATSQRSLIPGRLQGAAEVLYEFISSLVRDIIGPEGAKFFPYVFTLFIYILIANLFGLLPSLPILPHEFHTFTTTSHLAVTFALAMLTILIVVVYGFAKNGLAFFKLFVPSGVPLWLLPLIAVIELVSFLSRPISLSVRLFANMFAGHIILKLFAGFIISLLGAGGAIMTLSIFPLLGTVAVTMLEFLVAGLQAYVFAILTCIYLSDAAHAADH